MYVREMITVPHWHSHQRWVWHYLLLSLLHHMQMTRWPTCPGVSRAAAAQASRVYTHSERREMWARRL